MLSRLIIEDEEEFRQIVARSIRPFIIYGLGLIRSESIIGMSVLVGSCEINLGTD